MKPSTRRAPLASTAVCRQWWEEVGYHRGVNGAAGEAGIGMQTANESMTIWAPTISSSSVTGMQPLGDVGCVMGRAGAHDSPFMWGGRGAKSPFSNAPPPPPNRFPKGFFGLAVDTWTMLLGLQPTLVPGGLSPPGMQGLASCDFQQKLGKL